VNEEHHLNEIILNQKLLFLETSMDILDQNNETEIVCPANYTAFEEKFIFWVDGIALCTVSIPGLILNITGIAIILKHPSMHNVFNYLLISLFFFDSTYILTTMLNQSFMKQFHLVPRFYYLIYPHLMHPLKHISFTASIFMTTTLAYERNLAITDPIGHRIAMESRKTRRLRLVMYILLVVLASIIFNLPKFMEAKVIWENFNRYKVNFYFREYRYLCDYNKQIRKYFNFQRTKSLFSTVDVDETSTMHWQDIINPTDLRVGQYYSFYYLGIAKILVLGIFPLISLVYFNWKIYKGVKSPASLFEEQDKRQQKKENELAKVLIGIVMLFIICHTFRVAVEIDNMVGSKLLEECYKRKLPDSTLWVIVVDPLSEFMMVFNCAANMVIYCCLNANFRKLIFPCIKRSQESFSNFRSTRRTRSNLNTTSTELALDYMK
jgi:hypothetical protein